MRCLGLPPAASTPALALEPSSSTTQIPTRQWASQPFYSTPRAQGTAPLEQPPWFNNDNGTNNTAVGAFALSSNTEGSNNNALGADALHDHLSGSFNNAVGSFSLTRPDWILQ